MREESLRFSRIADTEPRIHSRTLILMTITAKKEVAAEQISVSMLADQSMCRVKHMPEQDVVRK